jgi:hypothetical protein
MNDAAKDAIVCVGAHFCDGDIELEVMRCRCCHWWEVASVRHP